MLLWIALIVFALAAVICIGYIALGAMDPEGRGLSNDNAALAGAAVALLMFAAVAGALVHRGFG